MIPLSHTWPYERIMNDLYVNSCPFCGEENVLLPFKEKDLQDVREGEKKWLIFPCCRGKMKIIDADEDYLLTNRKIRL